MKTKNSIIALCLLVTGMAFTGCSDKKDDPAPTPAPTPTKTEYITGKWWKMTAMTSSIAIDWSGTGSGAPTTDGYSQMTACEKDDLTKFNSPGGTYVTDAKTLCGTEPASETGTWSFNSTETNLIVDGDSYLIETLNSSTLKISMEVNNGTNIYTFTITYTRQ